MILASFAEVLSLGAVLPFLSALTRPETIYEHHRAKFFIDILGITSPNQLVFPMTVAFGLAALVSGVMRLFMLWFSTRLSFATVADLSMSVYRHTLYQPYAVHIGRNSSDVIAGISSKTGSVISAFVNILDLISSTLIFVSILFVMLSVNPLIALMAFGGFGLIYALVIGITRSRLQQHSQLIAQESNQMIRLLQEAMGGIRDILLDGSQEEYCNIFRKSIFPLRRSQGNVSFLSNSPRFVVEALGMLLIAGLSYSLSMKEGGLVSAIPLLGLLALGAQRMLPLLQKIYGAWAGIQGNQASLDDALSLLDQQMPEYADEPQPVPLSFRKEIRFRGLSFRYGTDAPRVLTNLDFSIPKGSRIGFIGTTGSGKSTLLDILMGLLEPTEGVIEVDGQSITKQNGRAWQVHIAHVPQSIFLADSSIEENIAFGIPKDRIDKDRVRKAASQAQIAELIETLPEKYKTTVGERGVRLSGGQRQRIGIARALYKEADVIIFDEATSALDSHTEKSVMNAIDDLSKELTVLIIAHRLSTLEKCDYIVELSEGVIQRIAEYKDVAL
ncbi:MAG: ABC transporter ATP-binding protein/permease [Chlorobium sp.]|nr:ABC transporter ATP-binding protein/permease [Chlorobium sp.]